MKPKIFKTKSIIALALALLMVMPILMAAVPVRAADGTGSPPVLSLVPTGTAGNPGQTVLPTQAAGTTFTLDLRIDNTSSIISAAGGITGETTTITWDPTVLQYVSHTDNSVMFQSGISIIADVALTSSGVTHGYTFNQAVSDASDPVNPLGILCGGPTESINDPNPTAPGNQYGVFGTITFRVLNSTATTNITINSDPSVTYVADPNTAIGQGYQPLTIAPAVIFNKVSTSISAFLSGSTSQSSYTFPAGTNPINNTFAVDLYMNNEKAEPVWAWNINVNWNPAVLQLKTIAEGTYLSSNIGLNENSTGDDTAATLFVPGFIDNTAGTVQQGISDVYLTNTTATNMAGVMCTLTFEVINYAPSTISISAGTTTSGTLVDNLGKSQGVDAFNSFQYNASPAPAATAPVAVINPSASLIYIANQGFTLDALSSQPGYDPIVNPLNPNVPITGYSWTVTNPGMTTVTGTASSLTFNAPSVVNGPVVVTLTVTTATTTDSTYVNSGSVTLQIQPGIISPVYQGALLDLYIVNNGTGTTYPQKNPTGLNQYNSTVDTFAPQQVMTLAAFASFNNASVADKLVTFTVYAGAAGTSDPSNIIASFVAYTNDNGTATAVYRLPNALSAVMPFGMYTIMATVDIAQVIRSDSITFEYNYTVNLGAVSVSSLVARSTSAASNSATLNIPVSSSALSTQTFYMTYTVTDANGQPIFAGVTGPQTILAGQTLNNQNIQLTIPSYAYVGSATVHVNIFNADPRSPTSGYLPYCPESDGTFTIGTLPS